jgi:propane monooxygenase small subunit
MAEATIPERSVPKPVFTDAEAGAKEFPSSRSRHYNYFTPRKRRASVYEDVTVDVQPDPARHLTQGWIYGFADGTVGYPEKWTALRSSNWHEFLDPNEEWEQTIYRNNADTVRTVLGTIANAKASHAFVERHVSAWAHAEHGLGMHVYLPAQRDAPTNMINNAMSVASLHKLRFAQDLILYNLELSEELDDFDGTAHREAWQEDPVWQPARENVERLTGVRDWGEAFFATAVVFEPLVGELFRSGFVMQTAALQGDYVTPIIVSTGESDTARDLRGARALFGMLAQDPQHGDHNREVMQGWLAQWIPVSLNAGQHLQPIWSQLAEKVVRYDHAAGLSRQRLADLLDDLTLELPSEVRA